MSGLLARDPLYGTGAARRRWEAMARANIARELNSLTTPVEHAAFGHGM
jgi:predicted metal-dependent HD superfamily phosphohydrolase